MEINVPKDTKYIVITLTCKNYIGICFDKNKGINGEQHVNIEMVPNKLMKILNYL